MLGKLFGRAQPKPDAVGAEAAAMAATQAKTRGNEALSRGDLAEAERCYNKAIHAQPHDPLARLNLGYVLLELGRPAAAVATLEQAIALRRPEDGFLHEAQFLHGRAKQALGRDDEALTSYRQALATQPAFEAPLAQAVRLLLAMRRAAEGLQLAEEAMRSWPSPAAAMLCAQALHSLTRPLDALATLDDLLAREPTHLGALESRGNLLLELDRNEEALATFERLLDAHGPLPQTLSNMAVAQLQLGRPAAAREICEQGLRIHPTHADLHLNGALAHMLLGDWATGWKALEWRWASWTGGAQPWQDRPRWTGEESLAGRSILLFCEQGLGDTLQFLRYVPLVAAQAREVLLLVQPALVPLLGELAPNCRVRATGEVVPATDFQCALLSLPLAFGTTLANVPAPIPYLHTDPQRVAQWRQRLGPGPGRRAGIAWSGNPVHKNDRNRSLPLALFGQIATEPWQFVSLQPEVRESDRSALPAWPGLLDLGPELRDFADTAAVLQILDLVVTVDTSVAHLAGALGRPVWILLPFNPDWRWLMGRADTPWYPTARLYRQPAQGAWGPVLTQVSEDLRRAPAPQ